MSKISPHMVSCARMGIGTDIVDIKRFVAMNRRTHRNFLERIFTSGELRYCFSRSAPAPHLAVRFAAKEAAVKALSTLHIKIDDWRMIEIKRSRSGQPWLLLPKRLGIVAHLSLSHSQNQAVAFVIAFL